MLVIVLVGGGESGSDWAAGMLQALREALDRSVVVDVRERDEALPPPPDAYALSVTFAPGKLKAQLDTVLPAGRPGKEVSFKKGDRPLDRGRAIGYAFAALLPELRADAVGPDLSPAAPTLSLHAFLPMSDYVPRSAPVAEPEPVASLPSPPRAALEAAALAGTWAARDVTMGIALAMQVTLGKGLALRAGGTTSFGGSPLTGTDLRRYSARLGFRLAALTLGPVALSLGSNLLALRVEMARGSQTLGRWLPAVEGGVEVALCVSRFAFFLAPTFQWAFGPTTVSLQGVHVATVPEQLFVLELGLRWWP